MPVPDISVIIPTYNQRERVQLVLCSLRHQTFAAERFEILLVDDGCTDHTAEMAVSMELENLRILTLKPNQGRNHARNMGVAIANGELLVFLDGDALPAPDLLACYWKKHQQCQGQAVLCGFEYNLPQVEHFKNPQTGELEVELPSVVLDYLETHLDEMVITEEMIEGDFDRIHQRALEGGYPYEELKQRQDQVIELLDQSPQISVGWLGFIPHNGGAPRLLVQAAGGFDAKCPFSEGWELAYRLQNHFGVPIYKVDAKTYHLYHFHPFEEDEGARREAAKRYRAIEYMAQKFNDPRIRLIYFWLAHLWPDPFIPVEARVSDLLVFDKLYSNMSEYEWQKYQKLLQNHPNLGMYLDEEVSDENRPDRKTSAAVDPTA